MNLVLFLKGEGFRFDMLGQRLLEAGKSTPLTKADAGHTLVFHFFVSVLSRFMTLHLAVRCLALGKAVFESLLAADPLTLKEPPTLQTP